MNTDRSESSSTLEAATGSDSPAALTGLESVFAEIERRDAQHWVIRTAREAWRQIRYESMRWPYRSRKAVQYAWQRVTRGWDNKSVWSLDMHLSRTVGAQLVYMADIAHGFPMDYPDEFVGWVRDLRTNGEALLRHAEDRLDDMEDTAPYEAAQAALRWVADHYGALWD